VYGPWGRPDMALFKFTKAILEEKPIEVFNNGQHTRDFTYVDDIVNGIIKVLEKPAKPNLQWNSNQPDPATSKAPWRIYNIGNNKPIELMKYINILEKALGKKAIINFLPLQPGDISNTYADISALKENFNYTPSTKVTEGINNFVNWYKEYYQK
jgi:UDP-glucuronate 4-epimerase